MPDPSITPVSVSVTSAAAPDSAVTVPVKDAFPLSPRRITETVPEADNAPVPAADS